MGTIAIIAVIAVCKLVFRLYWVHTRLSCLMDNDRCYPKLRFMLHVVGRQRTGLVGYLRDTRVNFFWEEITRDNNGTETDTCHNNPKSSQHAILMIKKHGKLTIKKLPHFYPVSHIYIIYICVLQAGLALDYDARRFAIQSPAFLPNQIWYQLIRKHSNATSEEDIYVMYRLRIGSYIFAETCFLCCVLACDVQ